MHSEAPVKPRRKKLDVQVHQADRSVSEKDESARRTFSANHPKRNKQRKSTESDNEIVKHDENYDENLTAAGDEKISGKSSRRHLIRENEQLLRENSELQEKLMSMDVYINKKNNKFKEKLNVLQTLNQEIGEENALLKNQYQELIAQVRAFQNELEVRRNCQKCEELNEIVGKQKNELILLTKSNKESNEDLNMLKNVVYRLNVQLERYQQKLHRSNSNIANRSINQNKRAATEGSSRIVVDSTNILSDVHKDHSHSPVSWGRVNAHTLGPLLDAYQETIAEKEGIIQEYEQQLAIFSEKTREITRENESLHRLLNEDEDCSKVLAEELETIKKELKSTKDQNDLLIKKCALKQDKTEEVIKFYEQKVEQVQRDYKILREEYYRGRTEMAALKERNNSLVQSQDNFKQERQEYIPISVHTASVNECKKWYEELKHQYEQERVKFKENINQLNTQIRQMTEKISELNKEKADLDTQVKTTEKQFKKMESKYLDLQHTLNKVQLSRSACRKQLHKAMNFAKDLVAEQESLLKALSKRQKENKAVKKLGSDIATRMDTLRSQLKTVQQEAYQELNTVEQRIQQQDSFITSLKKEHQEEIERLRQIIKEKDERNILVRESSSINIAPYLLFRDKNMQS
ncbi:centrosomal protein of 89 kda [Holotrichia oblita]|uniref:Centrosomal protein of 89 kDa n=1 Tax=Holotrichia oblita TaxID=644536 RepID=A0ACB9TLC0_HOLOL|nr:centrosomal protein of 89 kda [Holotrichia oblita]